MSYILDALRRADAERERGGVPSLHSQQYGALPGDEDEAPRRSYLLIGAIVVLVLALASVLLRNFLGGSGGDAAPTKAVAQAPVAPAPMAVALPPPALPAASLPSAATLADAAAAPAASATKGPVAASRVPLRTASSPAARAAPARPPAKAQARHETTASAPLAAAGERVYAMADLPEAIRRDLPKLAFGGATYSNDAASRMVILNGQVFHEGDTVALGLVLETVKRKSAVLAYKGYRYELAF